MRSIRSPNRRTSVTIGYHRRERDDMPLKGPRRTDPNEHSHPKTKIERTGMDEQPLQHVLVATHMHASECSGLV